MNGNTALLIAMKARKAKEGKIWKLKKPTDGLSNASRKWFLLVSSKLFSLGMSQSMGDSCLFYYGKNEKLEGLLIVHVDVFLSSGSSTFEEDIMNKLHEKYKFGRKMKNKFNYTGLDVEENIKGFM